MIIRKARTLPMSFPRYKKEMHATHHHAKHPGDSDSLLMHPVTAVASCPHCVNKSKEYTPALNFPGLPGPHRSNKGLLTGINYLLNKNDIVVN